MATTDCWYVNFDQMMLGCDMQFVANNIADSLIPGCYHVRPSRMGGELIPIIEAWGGGKTAAHEKRKAAKKNPEAEWVKRSIFIIRKVP